MDIKKKIPPEDRLEPVCRKCYYRRNAGNEQYYNGESKRNSTRDYLNIEGELWGCMPKGHICERFRARGNPSKNRKALILK